MGRQVLSFEVSSSLKGISAIEIMIGHLGITTAFWFLYPSRKAGILFVGIFFMLSGYGLMYSYMRNADYLKHFLIGRVFLTVLPAYMVYLLRGIIVASLTDEWNIASIIRYLLLGEFYQRTNWYVFEILCFYILFWCIYKFFSVKIANVLIFLSVIAFIVFGYIYRISNPWYGSSLCFPIGILYAQKEEKWNSFLCTKYLLKNFVLLLTCGICIIVFFILGNDSIVGNPVARNMASIAFSIWVLSLIQKVRIEWKWCQWLGKISYEIFLLHPVWIEVVGNQITEPWSCFAIVILLTFISAILLHIPISDMRKIIKKYCYS